MSIHRYTITIFFRDANYWPLVTFDRYGKTKSFYANQEDIIRLQRLIDTDFVTTSIRLEDASIVMEKR